VDGRCAWRYEGWTEGVCGDMRGGRKVCVEILGVDGRCAWRYEGWTEGVRGDMRGGRKVCI